jgi:hypothetical protein
MFSYRYGSAGYVLQHGCADAERKGNSGKKRTRPYDTPNENVKTASVYLSVVQRIMRQAYRSSRWGGGLRGDDSLADQIELLGGRADLPHSGSIADE